MLAFNKRSAANIFRLCSAAGSVSNGGIKGRRCLIPLFNCAVKIKQRGAREKCCMKGKTEGSVRRRSLKKKKKEREQNIGIRRHEEKKKKPGQMREIGSRWMD